VFLGWNRGQRDHYDRAVLSMGEVNSHRAAEELLHRGPDAPVAAADDDHFGVQEVGEPAQSMRDLARELPELDVYPLLLGYRVDLVR
jgi:hypothetical protein